MVMLLGFVHVRFLILPGAQDTNNLSFDGKSSNWVVNKTQFPKNVILFPLKVFLSSNNSVGQAHREPIPG